MEKNQTREELEVLFAYLTTTVALWIYLYFEITELSGVDPTSRRLLPYAVMHYCTFILVVSSILAFGLAGLLRLRLLNVVSKRINKLYDFSMRLLYLWWLPITSISLLNLMTATIFCGNLNAGEGDFFDKFPIVLPYFFLLIWLIVLVRLKIILLRKISFKSILSTAVFCIFFMPYLLIMSVLGSDVVIKLDKEMYFTDEKAYVVVYSKGYIFNPYLREAQFQFQKIDSLESINEITLDFNRLSINGKDTYSDYLTIVFEDQLGIVERKKEIELRIFDR